MRKFIEIIKEQTEEQIANGEPQEMIRVEVDVKATLTAITDEIDRLRASVGWTPAAAARVHECRHDDAEKCPCSLVPEQALRDAAVKEVAER